MSFMHKWMSGRERATTDAPDEENVDDAKTLRLSYRCARTVVTVSGTVTLHRDQCGKEKSVDRASVVSVGGGADRVLEALELKHKVLRDQEVDLSLAPDGRLSGAGYQSAGGGAEVIGGATSLANAIASTAVGAVTAKAAIAPKIPSPEPPDGWTELDDRRQQLKQVIADLQARAIKEVQGIGAAQDEGRKDRDDKTKLASQDELKLVETALSLARSEAAAVDEALRAWQDEYFPDWTTTFTYSIGVDELPSMTVPEPSITLTLNGKSLTSDNETLDEDVTAAALNLHTLVCRIEQTASGPREADNRALQGGGDDQTDQTEDVDQTVRYRLPYDLQLAIYELDGDKKLVGMESEDAPQPQEIKFDLRQLVPVWVLDKQSETDQVPIIAKVFSKNAATLKFGDTGALSQIANTDVGGAANIANAIAGALGGGTSQPAAAATAGPAPSTSVPAVDPTLIALQTQLVRAQLEANLATAKKTIRDSQVPGGSTGPGSTTVGEAGTK